MTDKNLLKQNAETIERWGMFEISVPGKTERNPFADYTIRGVFSGKDETVEADGFYDGEGIYKVRFMPSFEGEYNFKISGSFSDEAFTGSFTATPATGNNHGPVRVANKFHFAYEDGTRYYPIGTTCYVWTHHPDDECENTIETLKNGIFNKIRFCVLPIHFFHNLYNPQTYPYEGTPCDASPDNENNWDFSRLNPAHFQRFENYVAKLMEIGIEADIIVMHSYDRWGFSKMNKEADDLYWNYVVNRFSAYRNVWWSLANEWDFLKEKTVDDWERYAAIICRQDPYNHLRSVHNAVLVYDHSKPWVTHVSYQGAPEITNELREKHGKPVVLDEICYEGHIDYGWGNIDGEEMMRRFWQTLCRGGYPVHGETNIQPNGKSWWSHGGELLGESPERIRFLAKILSEVPGHGLKRIDAWEAVATVDSAEDEKSYYLVYFDIRQPNCYELHIDDETDYQVEIIDTWDMTITDVGVHRGKMRIELPGKRYIAVRFKKIK